MTSPQPNLQQRILAVQLYIQNELDGDLNLERLAGIAGYSMYHFHRLFRGVTGESTDDYVRRLRLERAAHALRYRSESILQLALEAGYGSHEAFTRAFVRMFGVTPSEYQTLEHAPLARKAQRMHTITYTPANVRIEAQPDRRYAYIRVVGKYCNANMGPAFERIASWAGERGLIDNNTLFIGVYHDQPSITAEDKLRSDAGVTIPASDLPTGDILTATLHAGVYAVLEHRGHYDTLEAAYDWLYGVWLPNSGREPGQDPPYEIYLNNCNTLPPEEWLTAICLPLK
jgi:AraC family transcriptional regulator